MEPHEHRAVSTEPAAGPRVCVDAGGAVRRTHRSQVTADDAGRRRIVHSAPFYRQRGTAEVDANSDRGTNREPGPCTRNAVRETTPESVAAPPATLRSTVTSIGGGSPCPESVAFPLAVPAISSPSTEERPSPCTRISSVPVAPGDRSTHSDPDRLSIACVLM